MKLLILSDLHLEHGTSLTLPPGLEYDAVVLAGDIDSPGVKTVHWAKRESTFAGRPVVYVPGNHEFYKSELHSQLREMREAAAGTNVHVLSSDTAIIGGVRFLGTTLWTDFAVAIDGEVDVSLGLATANRRVMDFRLIQLEDKSILRKPGEDLKRRILTAEDTLAMHCVERDWLRRELAAGHAGPTVVVTHHAPHRNSVAPYFADDWATPAFVSDLPSEFFGADIREVGKQEGQGLGPVLWVHGHTHTSFDYLVGGCRVVCNPRGYWRYDGRWENTPFNAGFIVEVAGSVAPGG